MQPATGFRRGAAHTRCAARHALGATLLGIVACSDRGPTSPFEASVASARVDKVDLSGPMPVLRVATSGPVSTLTVTYWSEDTAGYRVRVPTTGDDLQPTSIPLPRVAAGRPYRYVVVASGAPHVVPDTLSGTFTSAELPPELADIQFAVSGKFTRPLIMVEIANSPTGYSGFVIVDRAGHVVWQWRTEGLAQGSTRRANGNFVLIDVGHALLEVTPAGEVVHRLAAGAVPKVSAHHDVIPTAQNTLLFLSNDPQEHGGRTIVGDAIWEWTPETGELVKRWSTWTSFDPDRDWSPWSLAEDWVHANSLAIGPRGNVILSMRSLSQVVSISSDWQSLEWRMGGPRSTIKQVGGLSFGGQHSAQELPNGTILMFDNGWERPDGPSFSRLLELSIDYQQGTATPVWEYRPNPQIYAPIVGAARRLANGHTFGMFGTSSGVAEVATGPVEAVEVDAAGHVVATLSITNVSIAYRARPLNSLDGEERVSAYEIASTIPSMPPPRRRSDAAPSQ